MTRTRLMQERERKGKERPKLARNLRKKYMYNFRKDISESEISLLDVYQGTFRICKMNRHGHYFPLDYGSPSPLVLNLPAEALCSSL